MLAIDTNVVVRYLTGDHPHHSAKAKALIERESVFVALTVLLETEWVLRSVYGVPSERVSKELAAFCGLANVSVERPAMAAKALAWAEHGMDLADALHLAGAEGCDDFVTFDRDFAKRANALGGIAARTP